MGATKAITRVLGLVGAILASALTAGCATSTGYSGRPLAVYDKDTSYRIDDSISGFTVTVHYSRYQFVPEGSVVAAAGRSALFSIARDSAKSRGRSLRPFEEGHLYSTMGRNGFSGITSWTGTATFEYDTLPAKPETVSFGSGFLVSSTGQFVTANHVVAGASKIEVIFPDGELREATVVRTLPAIDLALLSLRSSPSDSLSLANTDELRIGTSVFTIGFPTPDILGQGAKYSDGAISGLEGKKGDASFIQISVPVQPGNSGGPLIGDTGDVIGVVVAKVDDAHFLEATGTLPQNVNFAVRADFIRVLLGGSTANSNPVPSTSREEAITRAVAATGLVKAYRGASK